MSHDAGALGAAAGDGGVDVVALVGLADVAVVAAAVAAVVGVGADVSGKVNDDYAGDGVHGCEPAILKRPVVVAGVVVAAAGDGDGGEIGGCCGVSI